MSTKNKKTLFKPKYTGEISLYYLKVRFNSLTVGKAINFKNSVCETLHWSGAVWYNKRHGITRVTPAERIVIEDLYLLTIEDSEHEND